MRRAVAIVAIGAAAFGLGTVASSASDPTTDVVHACKNDDHSVRIVAATDACRTGEQALAWNGTGPQGPAGAPGATGPAGLAGLSYHTVVSTTPAVVPATHEQFPVTVSCPAGSFVRVGGSVRGIFVDDPSIAAWEGVGDSTDRLAADGHPTADGTGWTGIVQFNSSDYSFSAQATAHCLGAGGAA
jgi:hypothetical protein